MIQPCSARLVSPAAQPRASDSSPSPSLPREASLNLSQATADPRILAGLDWVTDEVGSRVYYGTQNRLDLPADVKAAGSPAHPSMVSSVP